MIPTVTKDELEEDIIVFLNKFNNDNNYKDILPFKVFFDDSDKLRGILYQDCDMIRAWKFYGDILLMDATFGVVRRGWAFIMF